MLVSAAYGVRSPEFIAAAMPVDDPLHVALTVPAPSQVVPVPENLPHADRGYLSLPVAFAGAMIPLAPGSEAQNRSLDVWSQAWRTHAGVRPRLVKENIATLRHDLPERSSASTAHYFAEVLQATYRLLGVDRRVDLLFSNPRSESITTRRALEWLAEAYGGVPRESVRGRGAIHYSSENGDSPNIVYVSGIFRLLQAASLGALTVVPWYAGSQKHKTTGAVRALPLVPTFWPRHPGPEEGQGEWSRTAYHSFLNSPEFLWTYAEVEGIADYLEAEGGWSHGDTEIFAATAGILTYRRSLRPGVLRNHARHLLALCKREGIPSVRPRSRLAQDLADAIAECQGLLEKQRDRRHHHRGSTVRLSYLGQEQRLGAHIAAAAGALAGRLRADVVSLAVAGERVGVREKIENAASRLERTEVWLPVLHSGQMQIKEVPA